MSQDQELFRRILREESITPPLPSELIGDKQEFVLDIALESPQLMDQFLAELDRNVELNPTAERPRHIRQLNSGRAFLDFDNRRQSLRGLLDRTANTIISVVGPSGVGKSRLVAEVVGASPERWADRSVWVNCRSAANAGDLARLIMVSLSDDPADWLAGAGEASQSTDRVLVVLDDFEVDKGYESILTERPAWRFVTLSHVAIRGVPAEQLALDPVEEASAFDLLVNSIQSLRGDIQNLRQSLDPLRKIGTKLARLPLGLSLAAGCFAATPHNSFEAFANRVANTASASSTQPLDGLAQFALRGLTAAEYEYLQGLSLFQGSFTLDQAGMLLPEITLDTYLQRGLLEIVATADTDRFEIPDTVRGQLDRAPTVMTSRYVEAFVGVGENIRVLSQRGEWKSALRMLLDNLADLMATARLADDMAVTRLFRSIGRFAFDTNLLSEFETLASLVRKTPQLDPELEIQLLGLEGASAAMANDNEACERLWNRRLELSREFGNPFYIADTLSDLDDLAYDLGRFEDSIRITQETEAVAAEHGFTELRASALVVRAKASIALGRSEDGRGLLKEVVSMLPECRNPDLAPFVFQNVVIGYDKLGEREQAQTVLVDLLERASVAERTVLTGWSLGQLGRRFTDSGQPEQAARCFVAATKVYRATSSKHFLRARARLEEFRTQFGEDLIARVESIPVAELIRSILEQAR